MRELPSAGMMGSMRRRRLPSGGAAALAMPAFAAKPDTLVSPSGLARTLAAALEQARGANGARLRISVAPGVYREKLRIDVPHLTIAVLGECAVLTYGAGAANLRPRGGTGAHPAPHR